MNALLAQARFAALDGKKAEAIALAEKVYAVAGKADPKADVSPAERYLADWRRSADRFARRGRLLAETARRPLRPRGGNHWPFPVEIDRTPSLVEEATYP